MASVSLGENPALEGEWQRLWFSLLTRRWSAIAVIAPDSSTDVAHVAQMLAVVGTRGNTSVQVVSALGAQFSNVREIVSHLSEASGLALTLVPCDPVQHNPATVPILQATAGIVLVVRLGESSVSSVRKTVSAVGRDRVFASVAIG